MKQNKMMKKCSERSSEEEDKQSQSRRSMTERGDEGATCCLGIKSPSIILRNIIIPKDMWDEFPRGLNLSVSDYFLYQPCYPYRVDANNITKPLTYGMPYEEVWITTKDGIKLYAFLIKSRMGVASDTPTLIFFHGNAGSIGDRLENAKLLHHSLPLNILLVEYRGYGPSKGHPSERGLYRDAKAAFEYVAARTDLHSGKIFVFGRSLGGAVAIHLASQSKIRTRLAGLIVENTFTSVPSLARKIFEFPGVKYLPRWFYNNKYDNKAKVPSLRAPTLYISSKHDELLPSSMMKKLFDLTGTKRKRIVELPAGHNDAYMCDEYVELIYEFMDSALCVKGIKSRQNPNLQPLPCRDLKHAVVVELELDNHNERKNLNDDEDEWEDIEGFGEVKVPKNAQDRRNQNVTRVALDYPCRNQNQLRQNQLRQK